MDITQENPVEDPSTNLELEPIFAIDEGPTTENELTKSEKIRCVADDLPANDKDSDYEDEEVQIQSFNQAE